MRKHIFLLATCFTLLLTTSCKNEKPKEVKTEEVKVEVLKTKKLTNADVKTPEGMIWIPAGSFQQGAVPQDQAAMAHEKPQHPVSVDDFFMDITEVTNAQFKKFTKETGYITIAERAIDWEEMKKQLPPDTEKPHDSILQPGSLMFKKAKSTVPNLYDFSQWWEWSIGTNWRHPSGPDSNIEGKDDYPVVHVCFEDTKAYCNGQEDVCLRSLNGNMQLEEQVKTQLIYGEMMLQSYLKM